MTRIAQAKHYPLVASPATLEPWDLIGKWGLSVTVAAEILGVSHPNNLYRYRKTYKGRKRTPLQSIQVLCALYDQVWSKEGCPYA